VVYRAGDQLGAWAYALLAAIGAGVAGISAVAVGLAIVSVGNAIWLGRRMQRLAAGHPGAVQLADGATPAVEPSPGL
jgi:AAA family ATP:ADP antiporter